MKRPTIKAAAAERPNRLYVALAAAWLILSLALGGALWSGSPAEAAVPAPNAGTAAQP